MEWLFSSESLIEAAVALGIAIFTFFVVSLSYYEVFYMLKFLVGKDYFLNFKI